MGGKDERLLNHFAELAWNFQVIKFLDGDGRDVIPRKDKIWSLSEVAARDGRDPFGPGASCSSLSANPRLKT
jgi:hypothetical protein